MAKALSKLQRDTLDRKLREIINEQMEAYDKKNPTPENKLKTLADRWAYLTSGKCKISWGEAAKKCTGRGGWGSTRFHDIDNALTLLPMPGDATDDEKFDHCEKRKAYLAKLQREEENAVTAAIFAGNLDILKALADFKQTIANIK